LLSALAQGYAQGGQVEKGLKVIAEALAMVEKNEERWNEAELYRVKGELTLQQNREQGTGNRERGTEEKDRSPIPDPQGEAEACFQKAIAIAQKQQAKSLELRAVMSLVRLWQRQGQRTEAHQMLSEIYNWFTEGFDTKDLQEAKILLEELS
jgi:tetratricopeptide (TPR) repeat protein